MVPLQSSEPTIHLLHTKMPKLIKNILDLFINSKHTLDDKKKLLSAESLCKVDVTDEKIHLTKCDFGKKCF